MYRSLILLFLCFETSLSAPQQIGIETIAEVKPTIFDYPAVVYDDASQSYKETAIINGGRQDSSSDDFSYDITTENIDLETTEYADDITDNYERIAPPVRPTDDYENEKRTDKFYSKIGYFLNPYLVEDKLGIGKLTNDKQKNIENAVNSDQAAPNDAVVTKNARDNESEIGDNSNINKENPYVADEESNVDEIKPTANKNSNIFENVTSVVKEKPKYVLYNQNHVDSNIDNKPNDAVSKQSYFGGRQKADYTTVSLIQKTGRRKFRSNCRCEKIWNCPRLQISVPRCPSEYFMCCF